MKTTTLLVSAILVLTTVSITQSLSQSTRTQVADQESMLQSSDPKLAKNKKPVYDFWREVLEAGHLPA